MLAGNGYLGLGTLEEKPGGPVLQVDAFQDDPSRGVVALSRIEHTMSDLVDFLATERNKTNSTLVFFDRIWLPFTFGHQTYDPFESIGPVLHRAASCGSPEDGSRWMPSLATALWASLESDLFRFAFDDGFIDGLRMIKDSPDWRRFARLNDIHRAFIRALVPSGIIPGNWNAWIRSTGETFRAPSPFRTLTERLLSRGIGSIAKVMVKLAPPGALFTIPPSGQL